MSGWPVCVRVGVGRFAPTFSGEVAASGHPTPRRGDSGEAPIHARPRGLDHGLAVADNGTAVTEIGHLENRTIGDPTGRFLRGDFQVKGRDAASFNGFVRADVHNADRIAHRPARTNGVRNPSREFLRPKSEGAKEQNPEIFPRILGVAEAPATAGAIPHARESPPPLSVEGPRPCGPVRKSSAARRDAGPPRATFRSMIGDSVADLR